VKILYISSETVAKISELWDNGKGSRQNRYICPLYEGTSMRQEKKNEFV